MTEKRSYQRYSAEFKREAVRQLAASDKSCTQLARELGVRVNQLYKWKQQIEQKQADAFPGSGRQAEPEAEVARLNRELERLREENEILKKAAAYFAKSLV